MKIANIKSVFWGAYLMTFSATVGLAVCGCDTGPPVEADGSSSSSGSSDGSSSGSESTGDAPVCEQDADPNPGFYISVDEVGHPVISPSAGQGLLAYCSISGVGNVRMWCDFPCGETRSITVDMPTEPGLYYLNFKNPCEG